MLRIGILQDDDPFIALASEPWPRTEHIRVQVLLFVNQALMCLQMMRSKEVGVVSVEVSVPKLKIISQTSHHMQLVQL